MPLALLIGALGGLINGLLTVRTGINGFIITLATASAFTGINLGITESIPFYKMPPALVAFGEGRIGAFPLPPRRAAHRGGAPRRLLLPHRARPAAPRLWRQRARRRELSGISARAA